MTKSVQKCEVAIDTTLPLLRIIYFWATDDAAGEFASYGYLQKQEMGNYQLLVDPRFDFDEVMTYIKTYDERSVSND